MSRFKRYAHSLTSSYALTGVNVVCTLYFGCRDRKLYAASPEGKEKWHFLTGAWVDSPPALAGDGTIYFGSWDKDFYALNPGGSLKWYAKQALGRTPWPNFRSNARNTGHSDGTQQ
jgi:outer membrane protein assembly factor BamB